jgi:hypothetical protein
MQDRARDEPSGISRQVLISLRLLPDLIAWVLLSFVSG